MNSEIHLDSIQYSISLTIYRYVRHTIIQGKFVN